ncbi:RsiV family protein [Actinobacillus arthritidis]|uniref:RsiV family protein n=1 Tax=Actinobacillus arthritidis TaxID=157339 RepID=UPI0024424037|nr:RsiV family protein [Actinobacillus arthritidis]WGE89308.1 RsiV family protein [Actinobacillus arthritidis]
MNKTALSLLIAATLMLTACDDKNNQALTEKLQQAEQTITQLNQQITDSQQKLTALQQTVVEKSNIPQTIPALNAEIYPFFAKQERIKFKPQADQEQAIMSAEQYYFVSLAKTGFDWLDNLLAKQVLITYQPVTADANSKIDRNAINGDELSQLKTVLEQDYQENLATLKEGETLGITQTAETIYLGQRHNIVTFFQNYDEYSGGAHNNYHTKYFNIDVNKKRIILLDDLLSPAKQVELSAILWSHYEQRNEPDANGKYSTFTPKQDFYVSEDFLFTDDGVKFIYPPYALGPFAEGEISLTVPWYEINQLLNTEYQRKSKDGYDLAPDHIQAENE